MIAVVAVVAAILLQAYVGYPVSLAVLRVLLGERARHRTGDYEPSLTLLISVHNEGKILREKLRNTLELDYPRRRLRVLVVSDGSTDGTHAIVREFEAQGIELRRFEGRRGKVACLDAVIPDLDSDLVVMSDANSLYQENSLRKLVRHFVDGKVGCVCGQLLYVNPRGLPAGDGERIYWHYEGLIKRLESSLGSLLGANGAMYAYRRELFEPVDPLMFCDDVIPIRIALRGFLTLYDPEARCIEESAPEGVEMRRRRRHASFGLRSMFRMMAEALRRRKPLALYQCLSHRILRWAGGPALIGLLVSAPFLPAPWGGLVLGSQILFYATAAAGFLASRAGLRLPILYVAYYFLVINLAGLMGLAALLLRSDRPYWDSRR